MTPEQINAIPYGEVDRDLARLVGDRVSAAMLSVAQLADSPEAQFMIMAAAHAAAAGLLAGVYDAWQGNPPLTTQPSDIAPAILSAMEEAGVARGRL